MFSFLLRFFFAVQTGYIHPDEHFQSFQALYHDNLPWEFQNVKFINRSMVPLWVFYGPSIWLGQSLGLSALGIYLLTKLSLTLTNWIIIDWCLYRILPIKSERIKALFFLTTSWITMSVQNHTFSNSIETIILIMCVYLINDLRSHLENSGVKYNKLKLATLGMLVSFGTFNRVTFGAWLVLPGLYVLKYICLHPIRGCIIPISFLITSILIIALDTSYFNKIDFLIVVRMIILDINFKLLVLRNVPWSDFSIHHLLTTVHHPSYIIAPFNNLLYNLQTSNLEEHGLHPWYLHILVNYPILAGPLILLLPPFQFKKYYKTTPFLTFISGLAILSFVKHQEMRFLIPVTPLLSCIVSLTSAKSNLIVKCWIVYSLLLSFFYGMIHQAGVVPAMTELNHFVLNSNFQLGQEPIIVFWRTLKPPTWMLDVQHTEYTSNGVDKHLLKPTYLTKFDDQTDSLIFQDGSCNIIDLMGSPFDKLQSIILQADNHPVYIITPKNSLMWFTDDYRLEELWSTSFHMDLDHFEFDQFGYDTFKPGLGIYKLII